MKTEENESENSENAKENQPLKSTRIPMEELLAKHGVKMVDTTKEKLGTTSLMFFPKAEKESTKDDSVEASIRYLNRKKSAPDNSIENKQEQNNDKTNQDENK